MTRKERILSIVITLFITVFSLIPLYDFKNNKNKKIEELYRVYLDGKSIGVIESKDKLYEYINNEQKDLKDKFNVDTVYAPKSLYVSKYDTYDANTISEEEIYKKIKNTENFTIKGYKITIEKEDEDDIVFYTLNKDDFINATTSVVKAFVDADELKAFLNGEVLTIKDTGRNIEDVYIKEKIKIKEEYIPSNEKILIDEKEVTRYLLFGDDIEEKYYTVKAGDTIESIAEKNKLAVEELLVVNQNLKKKNNILSIGQQISVALISPLITIVEEEHVVEDVQIEFSKEYVYDSSQVYGTKIIKQQGKNGLQRLTQKIKYENGVIVNALIANREVLTEVINEIVSMGTRSNYVVNPEDIPDAGDWYWPTLKPYILSSGYGWRWGALHDANDITGTGHGSPIFAANNGIVTKAFYDSIGGYQIIIAHSNDIYTWYAHLSAMYAKTGDVVTRGQKIGAMGCTGSACTGTHLHFAAYKGRPGAGGKSFDSLQLYR